MLSRTKEMLVTFAHPFILSGVGALPSGTYLVATEEEQLQELSFDAYRLVETRLHVPAVATRSSIQQAFPVDADELEAALLADRAV